MELLAPAGDLSSLKAALLAGADAVYLAGKRFGARAFAPNFDEGGLRWARQVTASLGRKLYVTLNTLVFDQEWSLLEEALDFYEVLQPDALIIQDLGVAAALARRRSSIPRHLSTQGAWMGVGGVQELIDLGISRVILPRELSLAEIRAVAAKAPFELEVFVHGAMCYSISGRCFWSSALGTRSGNRGTCAQPCRKPYGTEPGLVSGFPFSPKDLRLLPHLADLAQVPVAAVKIEGRMKSAEYVYEVVRTYRAVLDGVSPSQAHEQVLAGVFRRPVHTGFLNGIPDPAWHTPDSPGREGVAVGQVIERRRDGLTHCRLDEPLLAGDGVAWEQDGERQGCRLTFVSTVADRPLAGSPGAYLLRGLPEGIPAQTVLWKTASGRPEDWLRGWNRDWERFPVDLFWSGQEGQPLSVETTLHGRPLRLSSPESLQLALGVGLEEGPLGEKFDRLGESFRARRNVTTALGKGLFIPAPALKKLKRALVEALTALIGQPPPPGPVCLAVADSDPAAALPAADPAAKPQVAVRIWNRTFPFLQDIQPDSWILPLVDGSTPPRIPLRQVRRWIPPILAAAQFDEVVCRLEELPDQEFLCLGWEAFDLARRFPRHRFRLDWDFNLVNRHACGFVQSRGVIVTAGREWPSKQPPQDSRLVWPAAWNPLVSLSRFPPQVALRQPICNPHKDRFFLLDLGNDVTGMFLAEAPASLAVPEGLSVQLDVAIGPGENPVRVASQLEEMIDVFRRGASHRSSPGTSLNQDPAGRGR